MQQTVGNRMVYCTAKGEQIHGLLYYYVIEGTSGATEESFSNCSSSQKLGSTKQISFKTLLDHYHCIYSH